MILFSKYKFQTFSRSAECSVDSRQPGNCGKAVESFKSPANVSHIKEFLADVYLVYMRHMTFKGYCQKHESILKYKDNLLIIV